MNALKVLILFVFCSLSLRPSVAQLVPGDSFPPTREGVEAMLSYIMQASHEERIALTEKLKPTEEDCMTLFSATLGEKVYHYQKKLDRQARIIVRPLRTDQTEILLWSATVEDLRTMSGDANRFPGGYHEIADDMASGYTLYRFKFVQPGRSLGSAYDMLVFVNGHWRLIHRPWAVLF